MQQPTQSTLSRPRRLLHVAASARAADSVSRSLSDELVSALMQTEGGLSVTRRDLADAPPPLVDRDWVDANFTPAEQRSAAQQASLAVSDSLVQELIEADLLVIGVPIYNFSIPASLKAWIDMVARARLTFRYTEHGAEGLLKGKRAYLVIASGGVPVDSDMDFATGYLRHLLGFIGITDVEVVAADQLNRRGDEALEQARRQISALVRESRAINSTLSGAA